MSSGQETSGKSPSREPQSENECQLKGSSRMRGFLKRIKMTWQHNLWSISH